MRIAHLTLAALLTILLAAAPAAADAPRSPGVGQRIINGHAPSQAWPATAPPPDEPPTPPTSIDPKVVTAHQHHYPTWTQVCCITTERAPEPDKRCNS